ncbi:DUF1523 family protein [Mesobacterium sp. TK19101]|uniref:DUF1523 family protein n=1 Tax=Mesobacterium hydrothermale TaxID=3111907 RepID=A0ABU6HG98_9RHOB|nr:DUF1523 family protein [Mesobacterium sp. TK19101]MEC3861326.1 DUF1523 family protein [Mesobacterium sp. TK19101]
MTYVKWTLIILFWALVGAFFHYTLPQHDVARIVGTENRRIDFGENSIFWATPDVGTAASTNRDVFFIQTVRNNGKTMVYRNEDTGWGWPPYFKFDTSNLQAEAASLISQSENPKWVMITHYGWRNEFLTIFPNAVALKQVDGPDATVIPWLNILILGTFFALVWAIWVRWRRFRAKRIDPVLEEVGESFEAAGDSLAEKRGRISRWLGTWKKK